MDDFACALHWFDRFLETRRGGHRAKFPGGIHSHWGSRPGNRRLPNPRDIGSGLSSSRADADDTRLTCDSAIADSNIVVSLLPVVRPAPAEAPSAVLLLPVTL